jgi:hypothetical protein
MYSDQLSIHAHSLRLLQLQVQPGACEAAASTIATLLQ